MKFIVLLGTHIEPHPTEKRDDGCPIDVRHTPETGVFESEKNLCKIFNTRTSRKFKRVPDDTPLGPLPVEEYEEVFRD